MLNFDSPGYPAMDILENMDIGVLVYDATGRLLFSNQDVRTLLGCSEESMPQWPGLDLTGSMVSYDMRPLPPTELPLCLAMKTGQPAKGRVIGLASDRQSERILFS